MGIGIQIRNQNNLTLSFTRNILDLLPATIIPGKEALGGQAKQLTDAEDILYQESILSKWLWFFLRTT